MNRFQFAFLLYYSACLYGALAGSYMRVCSQDMRAWRACGEPTGKSMRFAGNSYHYLHRI